MFLNFGPKKCVRFALAKLTLEHKAHPDITGPDLGLLFKILNTIQAAILKNGHKIGFWPQVKDPSIRSGLRALPLLHSQEHMPLGFESPEYARKYELKTLIRHMDQSSNQEQDVHIHSPKIKGLKVSFNQRLTGMPPGHLSQGRGTVHTNTCKSHVFQPKHIPARTAAYIQDHGPGIKIPDERLQKG
jgi:hypothetical protein